MMQWKRAIATKICLFGVLVAVLAGCNDSKSGQANKDPGAFHVETGGGGTGGTGGGTGTGGDGTGNQKVSVETKIVAGSGDNASPPGGGTATPPGDGLNLLDVLKTTRFTETAPDTVGGATYQSSPIIEYDMGNLVARSGDDNGSFLTKAKGQVRFPQTALSTAENQLRFPIIVFLHGQHDPAAPSYQGYDYIAEDLAKHGYVVVSIDANDINADGGGDQSSQSRAQLLLGTLDRLHDIDLNGQMDANKNTGPLDVLKGRLDFTRIGIMGHSRGGQGIANAIKFNQTRVGTDEKDLRNTMLQYAGIIKSHSDEDVELTKKYVMSKRHGDGTEGVDYDALKKHLLSRDDYKEAFKVVSNLYPTCEIDDFNSMWCGEFTSRAIKTKLDAEILPLVAAVYFKEINPELFNSIVWNTAASNPKIDDAKFNAVKVKYNLFYAAGRETVQPYDFKGAFMLAPTDTLDNLGVNNVPFAVLLPSCDGDVIDLAGSHTYDHNRFGLTSDMAPRYQILVKGANHNFYNTIWSGYDDGSNPNTVSYEYCKDRPDTIRLLPADQQRGGNFLISSFMRYYVGGEKKFAAYWNGMAQLPNAACPSTAGPCDERIVLTVQKGAKHRALIQRFEDEKSLEKNALGGQTVLSGFETMSPCNTPVGSSDLCNHLHSFFSLADHAELVWSKPNPALTTDLTGLSAKGMDYLTFRLAVVAPIGQEVLVTLTDSVGKTATITASDYSDALYNAPRAKANGMPMTDDPRDTPYADNDQIKTLLNMVAIPLKAFQGIDATKLKELKLTFPKESGKVAITDIELQNLDRENAEQVLSSRK